MQKIKKHNISKLTLFLILTLSGCQQSNMKNTNLYQQIGGQSVVESLTINLVDRLVNHDDIGFLFKDSNRDDLIEHISAQICVETGGNCIYEGRDMQESHSGLNISLAEFDIFVQEFIASMEDVNIPFTQQNKILALFAVMRDDIVHQ